MKVLNLEKSTLESNGACILSGCIHNIDELTLFQCDITEESVNGLVEQIKKRDTPVYQ